MFRVEIKSVILGFSQKTLITFSLSLVSRVHDIPGCALLKQHNTDLSVRLCLDSCTEDLMKPWDKKKTWHIQSTTL